MGTARTGRGAAPERLHVDKGRPKADPCCGGSQEFDSGLPRTVTTPKCIMALEMEHPGSFWNIYNGTGRAAWGALVLGWREIQPGDCPEPGKRTSRYRPLGLCPEFTIGIRSVALRVVSSAGSWVHAKPIPLGGRNSVSLSETLKKKNHPLPREADSPIQNSHFLNPRQELKRP